MNQQCMRRKVTKRRRFPVASWKIIIIFFVLLYFARYGLMGSPIFYGSMENYMRLAMKWKYHVELRVDKVSEDNYYLFSSGIYQGDLVDKDGYWYKCCYYKGKLYDNYSITVALKQELYDTLNQTFASIEGITATEYDTNFYVNRKNWLIGRHTLKQGIKQNLINVTIGLHLEGEDVEILVKECQEIYQKAQEFPFRYTIEVWTGKYFLINFYSDSYFEVTEDKIRASIVEGLKQEKEKGTFRYNWEGGFQR